MFPIYISRKSVFPLVSVDFFLFFLGHPRVLIYLNKHRLMKLNGNMGAISYIPMASSESALRSDSTEDNCLLLLMNVYKKELLQLSQICLL